MKNISTIFIRVTPDDTKDVLWLKFRRLTIGQNCSTVCISKGGHKERCILERMAQNATRFKSPAEQATKPQAK